MPAVRLEFKSPRALRRYMGNNSGPACLADAATNIERTAPWKDAPEKRRRLIKQLRGRAPSDRRAKRPTTGYQIERALDEARRSSSGRRALPNLKRRRGGQGKSPGLWGFRGRGSFAQTLEGGIRCMSRR
jgi:hypothetical protein